MKKMRVTLRIALPALAAAVLGSCSGKDDRIACIRLQTLDGPVILGVRYDYLEYPAYRKGGDLGGFQANMRWADLKPNPDFRTHYDAGDLSRPDWSLATTTATATVMFETVGNGKWPLSRPIKPDLEVTSDFPGWRKVKWCPDCSMLDYVPLEGTAADVTSITCSPPTKVPPQGHACHVLARVKGANARVSIPLIKLKDYRIFLEQAALLFRQFRAVGDKSCTAMRGA